MSRVVELNSADEYDAFNKTKAVVFFGSLRCGHCVHAKPKIDSMSTRYPNVNFGHVEVTKVKVEGIAGYPTFLVFNQGKQIATILGGGKKIDELEAIVKTM